MTAHNRKLKQIVFELDGAEYQAQVTSFKIVNNTDVGDTVYTFAPNEEFREETDPDYALEMTFVSDWRENGISTYLQENDGETVTFTIDHHPDRAAENVQWTGQVLIQAPTVGGEVRSTEMTEVELAIIGTPEFARVS